METRICTRCGRELPITEFSKTKSSLDGYSHICSDCLSKAKSGERRPNLKRCTDEELLQELKNRGVRLSKVEQTPEELMRKLREYGYSGTLSVNKTVNIEEI